VQLVNAADGYQLWSERYDREMKDIFDVQDEIALAVVDSLKLKLFGDEKVQLLKRGTENSEAYQLYLKGRYFWNRRDEGNLRKAIEQFKAAAELDPNYALALVGLADCYVQLPYYSSAFSAEVLPQAKVYLTRALEIDDSSGEVHASLGYYHTQSWNWAEAEKSFKRSFELNPNYAAAHLWFGIYLLIVGRLDEAEIECHRAIELEPLVPIFYNVLALLHIRKGDLNAAAEQCQRAKELDPNWIPGRFTLAGVYHKQGRNAEAIAEVEKMGTFLGGSYQGYIYARTGRQADAVKIVEKLKEKYQKQQADGFGIALVYGGLEKDQAFIWLEKEFQSRNQRLPLGLGIGWFDSLRDDPRYDDLLKQMGLPTTEKNETADPIDAKTMLLNPETPTDLGRQNADVGLESNKTNNPKSEIQNPKSKWWLIGLMTLILAVGGFFGYKYLLPPTKQINSIAVLPFENKNSDADSEYLSDGLAESLIYRLSQLPDLKVSPTSSVFRYKGKETDPQVVAKELGVDSVMTGRITQRGDSLTISVNLVDTRNGKSLWGEQYERKMSELLNTQREIASEITNKLQLKLSGDDAKGITKRYTNNNEAYQLYLKGKYHYAKRTKEDILKGIEYFEQAISLDPNFALAYVEISDSYSTMPAYPYMSPKEAFPKAKAAAEKALAIDPTLAEAHSTLGFSLAVYDWNWAKAKAESEKAIELNPNLAFARFRYGWNYLLPIGSTKEAIKELKQSLDLDPMLLVANAGLAIVYADDRQNEQALIQARKIYDLEPNFPTGRWALSQAFIVNGMYAEAIELNEKFLQTAPTNQLFLRFAGYAYAKSNRRKEAEAIINKFEELSKTEYVMSYKIANIYAALGEKDKAFAELEKAYENHDWEMFRLKVDPLMDPLRDDPRYKDLLKRMGLPE
jgi:adenylate cyclase